LRKIIISLLLFLTLQVPTMTSMASISKPYRPLIYSKNGGGIAIYWFYPGAHGAATGNLSSDAGHYSCPGSEDRQNAIMIPFAISPPVLAEDIIIYLSDIDPFPDQPGGPYTPLNISLRDDLSTDTSVRLWYGQIYRDPDLLQAGNRFSKQINNAIVEIFNIWVSLEWLPGYPTSPLVGLSSTVTGTSQYLLALSNPALPPELLADEYGVQINTLNWSQPQGFLDNNSDSVNFEVLFAEDTTNIIDAEVIKSNINFDSLYCPATLDKNGFISVLAKSGIDAVCSDYVLFEKEKVMPLEISPKIFDTTFIDMPDSSYSIQILNKSKDNFHFDINYDTTVMALDYNSILLPAQSAIDVDVTLFDLNAAAEMAYSFIISAPGYYPMIYSLKCRPRKPTDINEQTKMPVNIFVSEPYPNPFNPEVCLKINNPGGEPCNFVVYNLIGQEIIKRTYSKRGEQEIRWNGIDQNGREVSSGVYLFKIEMRNYSNIRKGILLR
jgi:hypothetical protein